MTIEKLYNIIGIVQRIVMVILSIFSIFLAYKIIDMLTKLVVEINQMYIAIEALRQLLHKSWWF
jgi:hypothetical protein